MINLQNNLRKFRLAAGLTQQVVADRTEISRQAYSAIEASDANPSTEVALKLARCLEVGVESLFFLTQEFPETIEAELVGGASWDFSPDNLPSRTRVYRVGNRILARPVTGLASTRQAMVEAEGTIVPTRPAGNSVAVQPFDREDLETPSLAMLGCDPSVGILEPELRRRGVRLVTAEESSRDALLGLARGEAHVAGCHLYDYATGTFNRTWVSRLVPFPCTLVAFASWQQGLMVAQANPKGILGIESLGNPGVSLINRQRGSGSRALLDRELENAGIPNGLVVGYENEVWGHLGVAAAVASGVADVGIGVKAAALAMGLHFIPLEYERYDLVIPDQVIDELPVQNLLDVLRRDSVHRRVESLGGYDASGMGLPAA